MRKHEKKNRFCRLGIFLVCFLLLFPGWETEAFANSAQSFWEGVDASGVTVSEGESPLEVEKETLTFSLSQFPLSYYENQEDFLSYSGMVRAEYTFYNPSSYTVTARLFFPFGNYPDYGFVSREEIPEGEIGRDTEKYQVTVNGQKTETKIRHSLILSGSQFHLEEDLGRLQDGFLSHEFFAPDLPVTKYTYRIEQLDNETYPAASAAFDVPAEGADTYFYMPEQSGFQGWENGGARLSIWAREGQDIEVYIFGTQPSSSLEWNFYENGATEDGKEIPGEIALEQTETLTLKDFALENWTEDTGVSQTDWYNAVVGELIWDREEQGTPGAQLLRYQQGLEEYLMRWYEYQITLAPGERLVNSVEAPMYPAINTQYEPDVYSYTYLLSPAQTWSSFGSLEIGIHTPYYMTESGLDGWEKTQDGYVLMLEGLPEGELEFSLSRSENPGRPLPAYTILTVRLVVGAGAVILLVTAGAVIFLRRRKRRKK